MFHSLNHAHWIIILMINTTNKLNFHLFLLQKTKTLKNEKKTHLNLQLNAIQHILLWFSCIRYFCSNRKSYAIYREKIIFCLLRHIKFWQHSYGIFARLQKRRLYFSNGISFGIEYKQQNGKIGHVSVALGKWKNEFVEFAFCKSSFYVVLRCYWFLSARRSLFLLEVKNNNFNLYLFIFLNEKILMLVEYLTQCLIFLIFAVQYTASFDHIKQCTY